MSTRSIRFVITFVGLLLLPSLSFGQMPPSSSTTSTPVPGVGHDYLGEINETVNPATGSTSIRISATMPPGRGLTLPFSFAYDSNGVNYVALNGGGNLAWFLPSTTLVSSGGWSESVPVVTNTELSWTATMNEGGHEACYGYINYVFQDAGGQRHNLNLTNYRGGSNPADACNYNNSAWPPEFGGAVVLQGGEDSYNPVKGAIIASIPPGSGDTAPPGPVTVSEPDGTMYYVPMSTHGEVVGDLASSVEDRNGNVIQITETSSYGYRYTDTLGRTVLQDSGFDVNPETLTVSGYNASYTLQWAALSTPSFVAPITTLSGSCGTGLGHGGATWTNAITGGPINAISTLTLPNGENFSFTYDPTYQVVNKMTYPTGAYVRYVWGLNDQAEWGYSHVPTLVTQCSMLYAVPVITDRYVSFNGTTEVLHQHFAYSTTWNTNGYVIWTSKQTTVTTTDNVRNTSYQTVYTYSPGGVTPPPNTASAPTSWNPLEQSIAYYDTSGTLLKTVFKTWATSTALASQETQYPSGQANETTWSYNSREQEIEGDDYDFGTSGVGSLLRKTITNYQAFNDTPLYPNAPSIVDRPCQLITYDSTGTNRVAETDYFYDNGATTTPCGAAGTPSVMGAGGSSLTGHDETNYSATSTTPRGNLTQKTQWLNTGPSPFSTYTYDETGQVLSMTDPKTNTTQYSYADSFLNTNSSGFTTTAGSPPSGMVTNAFLTTITYPPTNGVAHVRNFSYGYNDGEVTQSGDENSPPNPTKYRYNDPLGRLTESDFPDNGQTEIRYSDAAPSPSVTTCQLITGTAGATCTATNPPPGWKVSVSTMDGLGSPVLTELASDPDGATYTAISYDGVHRAYTQSNPYRSSPNGTKTFTHDALGRTTGVQQADGSLAQTFYDQTCTATTNAIGTMVVDEAGHLRESCYDGAGRLIEVDEPGTGSTGPVAASGSITVSSGSASCESVGQGNFAPQTGDITVTINGAMASAPWGGSCSGSTETLGPPSSSQLATVLASAITSSSAEVTATVNGTNCNNNPSCITLEANTTGPNNDYSVVIGETWTLDTNQYGMGYTACCSGSLSGGTDGSLGTNPPVTLYAYDALNNLLSVQQQGGTTSSLWRNRTFTYDSLSRLVCSANPEIQAVTCPSSATQAFPTGAVTYGYDGNGNMTSSTMPKAGATSGTAVTTHTYTYDADNRLLQHSHTNPGSGTDKFAYDGGTLTACGQNPPTISGATNLIGQRSAMCGTNSGSSFSYDPMGRLKLESRENLAPGPVRKTYSTAYSYYPDGSLNQLTYPSGDIVTYQVSTAGRVTKVSDTTTTFVSGATYAPHGALQGMTNGSSIVTSNVYNSRLQPIWLSAGVSGTPFFSLCYDFHLHQAINNPPCTFNAYTTGDNGNVFQIFNTTSSDATAQTVFQYDPLNRLLQANTVATSGANCWGETYTIDGWGNLTNRGGVSGMGGCTAELMNYSATTQNHFSGLNYDIAGNLLNDPAGNALTYDAENRIATDNGYTYSYDADGFRMEKGNGSSGTMYWPGSSGTLTETDLTGAINEEYLFLNGKRIARIDRPSGNVNYYFSDNLGSASVITDANANVKERYFYYPYGGLLYSTGSDPNHYKFTGKERDTESNLDMFGARYYGSSLGRFITPDWSAHPAPAPYADLSDPQTLNLYSYVRNNPLSKADPNGHGDCTVDGEKHGAIWCWAHKHGLVETQKEEADRDRAQLNKRGTFFDRQGNRVDLSKVPDAQVIRLYGRYQNDEIPPLASAVLMTQWGWSGSKPYRDAVKQLEQPGTHENLGGKVPTQDEAVQMIRESGGEIDRIEEGHGPESVSSHKEPHINYTTANGAKATVFIQAVTH